MSILIAVLILILAAFLILIALKGKGKPITLLDHDGKPYENGISTREGVIIGGKKQYFFIAGENKNNPVLLFLHGGPGSPEVAMHQFMPGERLEERFTVCYWEQRGAGLSYGARLEADKMTLELMVSDTIELTEHLMERFNQKQIYIMGHSWGTFLGTKVISAKPEYYKAYFGIGQVSDQLESERAAYGFLLQHATEIKDEKAVRDLKKTDPNKDDFPTDEYLRAARTNYMNKYGVGIKHIENYKMAELIKAVFLFEGYSALDFMKYGLGSKFSTDKMFHIVTRENLMRTTNQFEVPIYIFHGVYDLQVSYSLALQYFELMKAPEKAFYSFEHSAHSPNFEETKLFLEIVFSLLDRYK
ncbi:alpha/beta hydrolase [Anoxybacterium hadale]|uniref:Alpha/beta hydrolase n=1 Tax=Anoxybacterium hadale TaxID=3408580 RepID=A0ACD1AD18_9FIRM|nr:alpha/beta hydrolase [Clostridiales bacterium]